MLVVKKNTEESITKGTKKKITHENAPDIELMRNIENVASYMPASGVRNTITAKHMFISNGKRQTSSAEKFT